MRYTAFLRRVSKTTHMLGKPVSDFSLACTGGTPLTLFDDTPGCSAEARAFGILRDAVASHPRWKKIRGIERSTSVLDANGVLAREWRGVKVPGHAQEVSNFVKAL